MKSQEETKKTEQQAESKTVCVAITVNTCIACGREIPEGQFVCMECEIGTSARRCTICDRPISEFDAICPNCRAMLFRSQKKK